MIEDVTEESDFVREGGNGMIWSFIGGLFVGMISGVFVTALLSANRRDDKDD